MNSGYAGLAGARSPLETYAVVTHERGSWRWQDRYALVAYRIHRTRDDRLVWRADRQLNGKVKPREAQEWAWVIHSGSLHNRPVQIHVSTTGEIHGVGSNRYKWVSRLTDAERQAAQRGELVIVTGAPTHAGNPPFRMVVHRGGRYYHRVPPRTWWGIIKTRLEAS